MSTSGVGGVPGPLSGSQSPQLPANIDWENFPISFFLPYLDSLEGKSNEEKLQEIFGFFMQNYADIYSNLGLEEDPDSVEGFAKAWFQFVLQASTGRSLPERVSSSTFAHLPNLDEIEAQFVEQFSQSMRQRFADAIGSDPTSPNFNFAGINLPEGVSFDDLFDGNFSAFIQLVINEGVADYASFFKEWTDFVGPSLVLGSPDALSSQSIATYMKIYNQFYPTGPFLEHLNAFISQSIEKHGYFNPSQMIEEWFNNLVAGMYGPEFVAEPSWASMGDFEATRILNQLYRYLANMVEILQELTVAQSGRLEFFTKMQEAYTKAMESVAVVVQNPKYNAGSTTEIPADATRSNIVYSSPIDTDSKDDAERRSDFNQLSAKYLETLRSFRSEMADMGAQFEAAFTQSNEAVNTEIAAATAILQLVNTIANVIFSQQQSNK